MSSPPHDPGQLCRYFMEDPEDISLRPYKLDDVDDYMEWRSDERVLRFFEDTAITTKEEALKILEEHVIPHPWHRAICLRGRPVGYVLLRPGEEENEQHIGYIAYGLSYEYWGRGIATVAVKKATCSIFCELRHIERIEAFVAKDNVGSQRVILKAGFTEEGLLSEPWEIKGIKRDVVKYGLTRFEERLLCCIAGLWAMLSTAKALKLRTQNFFIKRAQQFATKFCDFSRCCFRSGKSKLFRKL